MAKRIDSSEIVQDDLLKNLRESVIITETKTQALVAQMSLLNDELKEIKKSASTIKGGIIDLGKTNTKDLDARANAQKTSNQLAKEAIQIEQLQQRLNQEILKSKQQEEKLRQAEIRTRKLLNSEKKKELTAYQLESKALNEMRDRYKHLAVQKMNGIKLTKEEEREFRRLLPQIRQTDQALKKIDASVGQFGRNVGNYPKVINGFRSALSQLGLSFGVFQLLGAGGKSIVNFENSLASFRTIVSDLNDNQFNKFKSQIKSVADETKRSNTEIADSFNAIAGLNSEFAKTSEGLGEVSEAVTVLSDASKDDLKNSAESLVGIMNQFDLSANQANRTINVLAAGQAVGASSITQSAEAYKNFGAVAKGANITLEESQALIQVLGKNTIFGAEAGTKLRGVTLQLQKAQLGYASGTFNINDALKEFNKKLSEKKTASAKDAYATKVFGAENITAGKIISGNIPLFEKFTKAVTDTTEAQKAQAINNNTLSKRWEQFKNALENTVTSSTATGGALDGLKDSLKFLTDNLEAVLSVVKTGIQAWITYKAVMTALNLKSAFTDWKNLGGGVKNVTENLKEGQSAGQKFGQAMSGIGFTAIITALVEVAKAWYDVASGANQARWRTEQFNKATSSGTSQAVKWLDALNKKEKQALDNIETRLSKRQITEQQAIKLRKEAISQTQKIITQEKTRLQAEKALLQVQLGTARANRDRIKENLNPGFIGNTLEEAGAWNEAEKAVTDLLALEKRNTAEIIELNKALEGSYQAQHDLNIEQNKAIGSTDEKGKKVKELNTQLKEQKRYLSEQLTLVEQLNSAYRENLVSEVQTEVDAELQRQVDSALKTGQFDNLLTNYKDLVKQRTDISIDGLKKEAELRKSELDRQLKEQHRIELENIISNRDESLSQEGLTEAQKLIIQQQFDDQIKKLDADRLLRQKDVNTKKLIIDEKLKGDTLEIVKQGEADIIDAKEKTKNAQQEFLDELGTATKETLEKNYEDERKFIELTTKFLEDQIDKRIAKLNEFTEASKKQQADLQEMANNGNIKAQQSIAREAQLQREAEKAKQDLERRKAFVQLIGSFLTNYTNRLEKGENSTQALAGAIADKAVLEAIINTIPAFKDGGTHEGGLMLVNDAPGSSFREIIQTPDGKTFSPEGRNVIMNAPAGTKIHTQDQWAEMQRKDAFRQANSLGGNSAGNSYDLMPLLKEVKGLKKAISDQPDRWSEFMQITQKSFELHFVEKKGNHTDRIIHQYRTKK